MQRKLLFPILLALFLVVVTAVTRAQDDPTSQPVQEPIVVTGSINQMIDGAVEMQLPLQETESLMTPLQLNADEPADSCEDATFLLITPSEPGNGGSIDVSDASEEATDPVLSCMWGNPTRNKGYRTVWYQLVAPADGLVRLDTFNSGYDTVLAVYKGTCDALTQIRCNDDQNGFTSETTVNITEGETYYVEIADWQASRAPNPVMQISALLEPVDLRWESIIANEAADPISRHAVVAQYENLYVIGGQTGGEDLPQISNRLLRFNTATEDWTEMQSMPDIAGYSNTTAALINDRIYVPSGYNGNDLGYDGLHLEYNILTNSWKFAASIPKAELPDGQPFAWASAVVPPTNNRYYLTGGMTTTEPLSPNASVSDETYVYFPSTDSWSKLKPMQAARYAHTAAWIETGNHGICVAGGLGVDILEETGDPVTVLHRSVECYTPGGSWNYIGDLNIPRFGAGSAVGPDGKWYVYGGRTTNALGTGLVNVFGTEVYNPVTKTWTVMDPSFNLGTYRSMPARFWPRGAMVDDELWVIGGSIIETAENALPTIDKLYIPIYSTFLPIAVEESNDFDLPDDNFADARRKDFGGYQHRNFDGQRDWFDYYYFDLNTEKRVTLRLEVPEDNNFNLELYGENKRWWSGSYNVKNGEDEEISLVLQPRRYYVRVIRAFPTEKPDTGAFYTLRLD